MVMVIDKTMKEVYLIEGKVVENSEAVLCERRSLGRFILSSNATIYSVKDTLKLKVKPVNNNITVLVTPKMKSRAACFISACFKNPSFS